MKKINFIMVTLLFILFTGQVVSASTEAPYLISDIEEWEETKDPDLTDSYYYKGCGSEEGYTKEFVAYLHEQLGDKKEYSEKDLTLALEKYFQEKKLIPYYRDSSMFGFYEEVLRTQGYDISDYMDNNPIDLEAKKIDNPKQEQPEEITKDEDVEKDSKLGEFANVMKNFILNNWIVLLIIVFSMIAFAIIKRQQMNRLYNRDEEE